MSWHGFLYHKCVRGYRVTSTLVRGVFSPNGISNASCIRKLSGSWCLCGAIGVIYYSFLVFYVVRRNVFLLRWYPQAGICERAWSIKSLTMHSPPLGCDMFGSDHYVWLGRFKYPHRSLAYYKISEVNGRGVVCLGVNLGAVRVLLFFHFRIKIPTHTLIW